MALLSIALHAVLFFHLAEVYSSHNLSVIELSLEDVSRPEMRDIPRPRPRPKSPPETREIARPRTQPRPLPAFKPLQVEPARAELPDSLMERIGVPDIPKVSGIAATGWNPQALADAGGGDFGTSRDYLDLIRLRIESKKKYPESAKNLNREGKVTVRFTILKDGATEAIHVYQSSRNPLLDRAALQAIQDATPFPPPPGRFFSGDVPVELTIVFELT
jgi:protein TonB